MNSDRQPSLFAPQGNLWSNPNDRNYPDTPGHNFRDTSIEAAKRMEPKAAALRLRVLGEIQVRGDFGATCDELVAAMGLLSQSASARLRELFLKGKIKDSGKRRLTRYDRNAIVWIATEGQR